MKKIYLLLLTFSFAGLLFAQKEMPVDSAEYYQREISKIWRQSFDSIYRSEKVISLRNKLNGIVSQRNNYGSVVLFGDILHSDYSAFKVICPHLMPSVAGLVLGEALKMNIQYWTSIFSL